MTKTYDFALVDAFTTVPLSGNPCSIVVGADSLDSEKMLAIAKEMNQSETAFLMKSEAEDLKARYFTPAEEIPLAGHPSMASIHLALELGLIDKNKDSISLELNDGPIKIGIQRVGNEYTIQMFQRKPVFTEIHNPSEVLSLFNLRESDLLPNCMIQTVSTGTRQLMVPLKDHESLKKVKLDNDGYTAFQKKKKKKKKKKNGYIRASFFLFKGDNK
ncbi:MAG: PhzF family phenazine biosynthesis protein [Bdellovibrionaceae bacterium]|nr:PhzF family phenazine biosynthesis protein [Pseudobdellovibrionaceae bacterium]